MPVKLQDAKLEDAEKTKGYPAKASSLPKHGSPSQGARLPRTPMKFGTEGAAKSLQTTPKSTPIHSPQLKKPRVFSSPKTLFEEEATLSAFRLLSRSAGLLQHINHLTSKI